MFEKFRQKSFPRFYLRTRLDEYNNYGDKRFRDEGGEYTGGNHRNLFDFFPLNAFREMHSFLFFKITLAFSLVLLVFFLSLINLPFSRTLLGGIHYMTVWKTDFLSLGKQAAPVVKSLWEGSPEKYLEVWSPFVGRNNGENRADHFSMPLEGQVVKNFGYGYNPKLQMNDLSYGLLFSAPGERDVAASAPGKVDKIKDDPYYGLLMVLKHPGGIETCYGYLGETFVSEGDEVGRGQRIARTSKGAEADVYYLYFEARENGKPFDPLPLFVAGPEP